MEFSDNQLNTLTNQQIITIINDYADKCEKNRNDLVINLDNLIPKQKKLEDLSLELNNYMVNSTNDVEINNKINMINNNINDLSLQISKLLDKIHVLQKELEDNEQNYARLIYFMKENRLNIQNEN